MVTSGFYDTRYYNADQFGDLFDGIITEGIFTNVGSAFDVQPAGGMSVTINSGKAWCGKRWLVNDSKIIRDIATAHPTYPRIDAIVIESNNSDDPAEGKAGRIIVKTGVASNSPQKPEMADSVYVKQMPICWINLPAGATEITLAMIESAVGRDTPAVTGLLQQLSLAEIYNAMQGQMPAAIAAFQAQSEAEFNAWFLNLEDQLTDNQAYNLQRQINELWREFGEIGRAETMAW